MFRPHGTLKSNIFRIPAIKMAGYGIGRPDGTFWMSIAGHWGQNPAALPDSLTIGIKISGQALSNLTLHKPTLQAGPSLKSSARRFFDGLPPVSSRRGRSSSGRPGDADSIRAAYIQSRSDQEQEKNMFRPHGTLKSNIFLIPAIKMAGYGIGRPYGTFWMSIAGHWGQTPAALPDSLTIGIKRSGQARLLRQVNCMRYCIELTFFTHFLQKPRMDGNIQ